MIKLQEEVFYRFQVLMDVELRKDIYQLCQSATQYKRFSALIVKELPSQGSSSKVSLN
jgi:hypothetical protein